MKLLHVVASPSGAQSLSTRVGEALVAAHREANPAVEVETIDVWDLALPPFDATMIAAKLAVLRAQSPTPEQSALWARAVAHARRFNAADRYVFSLPMWNYGIPYQLKHYIDVVTLAGENWTWSRAGGYVPLLQGKRAALVCSSAGDFPLEVAGEQAEDDFQKPYMRKWLRFLGIALAGEVVVGPTLDEPARIEALVDRSLAQARRCGSLL